MTSPVTLSDFSVTAGIVDEDILKAEAEAGLTEEYFDARQKEVSFFIYLYNTYFHDVKNNRISD